MPTTSTENIEFTAITDDNYHLSKTIFQESADLWPTINNNTNIKLQYAETISSTNYYYIIIEPDNRLLTYTDSWSSTGIDPASTEEITSVINWYG